MYCGEREAIDEEEEEEERRMIDAECRDMSYPVNTTRKMTCLIDY